MVSRVVCCPHCQQSEPVVRSGYNRGGSAKCKCKACNRIFTPESNSRRLSAEKEAAILRALEERLSIEAIARMHKVAKKTIYKVLKKRDAAASGEPA